MMDDPALIDRRMMCDNRGVNSEELKERRIKTDELKEVAREIKNLGEESRRHTAMLVANLLDLAQNSKNDTVRLNAINSLLDRGHGKAVQSVDLRADVQSVNLNLFQDLPAADQRLASEVLGAISSNPSALALAIDIMAEPDIVVAPFGADDVIEVIEVVPVRAGDAKLNQAGEVIDLVAEPVDGDGK
jgi:hypothetical protein